MDNETLAQVVSDIDAHLAASGLAVFPSIFDEPDLFWPDENWRSFLEVALRAGARIIYLEREVDVGRICEQALEMRDSLDAPARAALKDAQAWKGPTRVKLGFIIGGARHFWGCQADWIGVLEEAIDDSGGTARYGDDGVELGDDAHLTLEEREVRQANEAARVGPMVDTWVGQLSEAPTVLAAPNQTGRLAAARDLIPELDEWRNLSRPLWGDPEALARRDAVWAVHRRLDDALVAVKEQRVAAAREQLESWAQDLATTSDFRAAANADMRRRAAGAFVAQRLGFASTDVRDRLLAALRH